VTETPVAVRALPGVVEHEAPDEHLGYGVTELRELRAGRHRWE